MVESRVERRQSALSAPMSMDEPLGAPPEEMKEETVEPPGPSITIKPWDPDTPYLKALARVRPEDAFTQYMEQKKTFGNSPAFFLESADFFRKLDQKDLSLQILSNVAEMALEDAALLRVLAHRLAQLNRLDLSAALFEDVLYMRPEEPQSYRDLALVLARQSKYRRAVELLYHVVMTEWDRFREIEVVALMELNHIMAKAKAEGITDFPVDPRLIKLLDVDVRIVLTWDADLSDMDLWVIEPSGEKAYYKNNLTTIGGKVSRDFTQGYGPEEYVLRKGVKGVYQIQADYYGSNATTLTGAVTLQVDVFTNYGRANEKKESITLRLTNKKEVVTVGQLRF